MINNISWHMAGFLIVSMLVGCGGGRGSVQGTVTLGGKPIVYGTVTIVGSDGIANQAVINPDGTYEILDIAAGECKVGVASPNPAKAEAATAAMVASKRSGMNKANPPVQAPTTNIPNGWFPIPENFADPETSNITVTVKRGKSTLDIVVPAQ